MTKKEVLFVVSLFLIGFVLLVFSKPFTLSYDFRMLVIGFFILLVSQYIEIPIAGVVFNTKAFIILFLLLFLNPESLMILALSTILFNRKAPLKIYIFRLGFEFLQFAVGIFLFKLSPGDYLSLILFATGYFITNIALALVYKNFFAKVPIENMLRVTLLVLLLGVYAALILTTIYLLPEARITYLIFTLLLYAGFLTQLLYTVKSQVWLQELTYEQDEIGREIENLSKLQQILEQVKSENTDVLLKKLLEVSCSMIGFEASLLNLFDYNRGKVIRISAFGMSESDFEQIKSRQPDIKDTLILMQSRFDSGGVYFIPKGSIALDDTYTFRPLDYAKLDAANAWDPDDLFLVPLILNNKMIGYISFDKPVNGLRPSKREIELSKFFAWQFVQILKESKYSQLFTSSYGKEVSISTLMNEMAKAIETKRTFTFLYLDIDNFDKINLQKGYQHGDDILRDLKNYIENEIKNLGIYTHIGDAFKILLWTKSKSDGMLVAEKVSDLIREKYPYVRITGAIVKYPVDADNLDGILNKARTALTAAKKSGGGRIINL
ncbi:diguanylate cyclase [Fervidobacterium sp.]